MSYNIKPSIKYVLTGLFDTDEKYHPDIHNQGDIYERNKNYNTTPNSTYYSPDEIERMKNEVQQSQVKLPSLNPSSNNDISRSLFQKVDWKKKEKPKQTLVNYNRDKLTVDDYDTETREVIAPSGKSMYKEKMSLPNLTQKPIKIYENDYLTNPRSTYAKLPRLGNELGGKKTRRKNKNKKTKRRQISRKNRTLKHKKRHSK